jgi:hypothetical protein
MPYPGSCHCGAVGFLYDTRLAPQEWSLRACQCSFCRAHGARSTSDPLGAVAFHVRRADALRRYRFGHRLTDFLLCGHCGVYVGAVTDISGHLFAIINTNALHPFPAGLKSGPAVTEEIVNYEGESAAMRSERRRKRWTPCAPIASGFGS